MPPVARAYWMDLTWYGMVRGHLLIGRGMKRLWRSHDTYPAGRRFDVEGIALGRHGLAFTVFRSRESVLFVARYGRREQRVARGEWPLAFMPSGLVIRREHKTLLLRTGGAVRFLAHAIEPQVDRGSRMVVFRSNGRLFAFDGVRIRDLVSLRKHGVTGPPVVDPLGRLVAAHDRRGLVVVGYDGRLFASAALPRSRHPADGVSSPVAANAAGTVVAFSATSGNRLRDTVYLLGRGESRAQPRFAEKLAGGNGCGQGDWLAWKGKWLLYANGGHQAAILDGSGRSPALDLGDVIGKLPGFRADGEGAFDVSWA